LSESSESSESSETSGSGWRAPGAPGRRRAGAGPAVGRRTGRPARPPAARTGAGVL